MKQHTLNYVMKLFPIIKLTLILQVYYHVTYHTVAGIN